MQDWAADYEGGQTTAGGERRRRHGVAITAAEAEDGGGGRRRQRTTTAVKADSNNGDGGRRQRQRRTTTAADDDGTQDQVVDYEGEGGERAANNNGIRAHAPGRERDKINKSSLCKKTFFSNTVCRVGFFAPAKTLNRVF